MKATELMLGDWVLHDGRPKQVNVIWGPRQVSLIDWGKTYSSIYTDKCLTDEIEPLPLTTEILEKNFPTMEDGVTWNKTADSNLFNIRVEYDKYVEGIFKFVHELQHALCLCGIDIEIIL